MKSWFFSISLYIQCLISLGSVDLWSLVLFDSDVMTGLKNTEEHITLYKMSECLLPKRHIANRKTMEEFECFICYELTQDMEMCKGPCSKPYCMKCIGRIKTFKNVCPSKCSAPFITEKIANFKIQYHCPYQPQICELLFNSVEDFQRHCQECTFKTAEGEKEIRNRKRNLCNKGHKLRLVTAQLLKSIGKNDQNFYKLVMNDLCAGCGGRNLCRSICVPCSQQTRHVYCIDCRRYPFTKTQCPQEHPFIEKNIQERYLCVCDVCGISACLKGNSVHSQQVCDLVVCEKCYEKISQHAQEEKQQEVSNFEMQITEQSKELAEIKLQKPLIPP